MKKLLALLLAAMMLLGMAPAMAEDIPELTILLEGNNVTDDAAVLEVLNPYLAEKIGVTIKPVWGTWGNFDDLAYNEVTSGAGDYDMMFTCSWTKNDYSTYAKKGAYVKLDDYIAEHGADLVAALPALLMEGAVTEGPDGEMGIYAVPGFKDFATMNTWDVRPIFFEFG